MKTLNSKKFKNAFDYDHTQVVHEVNNAPSETVPEMTLSLKELLKRYTRGGEVATLNPVYQENSEEFDENPDLMKLDGLEKLELASEIKHAIKERQSEAEKRQKSIADFEQENSSKPPKEENKDSENPKP